MIQDVSKMDVIKILEVLCSLWDFDCLYFQKWVYLVYLSIIISGESIQAYGAQLVTVAIAQFRWVTWHALEIFEVKAVQITGFLFTKLWFTCFESAQWVWWFRFAANAQNLEPTRGHRSDVSGTVTTKKPKTRPRGLWKWLKVKEGSRWNNWETRSRV